LFRTKVQTNINYRRKHREAHENERKPSAAQEIYGKRLRKISEED
jgi:hypothetical protein